MYRCSFSFHPSRISSPFHIIPAVYLSELDVIQGASVPPAREAVELDLLDGGRDAGEGLHGRRRARTGESRRDERQPQTGPGLPHFDGEVLGAAEREVDALPHRHGADGLRAAEGDPELVADVAPVRGPEVVPLALRHVVRQHVLPPVPVVGPSAAVEALLVGDAQSGAGTAGRSETLGLGVGGRAGRVAGGVTPRAAYRRLTHEAGAPSAPGGPHTLN